MSTNGCISVSSYRRAFRTFACRWYLPSARYLSPLAMGFLCVPGRTNRFARFSVVTCLFQGTGKGRRAMPRQVSLPKDAIWRKNLSRDCKFKIRLFSKEEMKQVMYSYVMLCWQKILLWPQVKQHNKSQTTILVGFHLSTFLGFA